MADAAVNAPPIGLTALQNWLREFARLVDVHRDELTALDAAIGDADHGTNMHRGMSAVLDKMDADLDAGTAATTVAALFKSVGMTLVSKVGGASGPLYGTFFLRFGAASGDGAVLSAAQFAHAMRAGLGGVVARGKAVAEDKTMVDALAPAVDALDAGISVSLSAGLDHALVAAEKGRDSTVAMQARKGRASYLGERSVGHADPGATSVSLLLRAAATALA